MPVGKKQSQRWFQVGEQCPSLSPALPSLQGHKRSRWGLLPCPPPSDWAGTPVLLCVLSPPCWYINKTALFKHLVCQPLPLQTTCGRQLKLSLWVRAAGGTAKILPQTKRRQGLPQTVGASYKQLSQAPEIPLAAHQSPALVAHPGASAIPLMSLLKRMLLPPFHIPTSGPFIYAGGGLNIFLCSSLALKKCLSPSWQQAGSSYSSRSPEGPSVSFGFITIISFTPLSCFSLASFNLTLGCQPEESQAGKLRHM